MNLFALLAGVGIVVAIAIYMYRMYNVMLRGDSDKEFYENWKDIDVDEESMEDYWLYLKHIDYRTDVDRGFWKRWKNY